MAKHNGLVAGLDQIEKGASGGTTPKIVQLFGDQPDVLEAIRRARRDRHLSYAQIALYLSQNGYEIKEGAVKNWLTSQGIG